MEQDTSLSCQLARYSSRLDINSVPSQVVDYAKILLLDLFGAALAGTQTEEAGITLKACHALANGQGESVLWGTGVKSSEGLAALHNGIIAHALELDDFNGADHSSSVIIPTVLAMAGRNPQLSAKRLLEAIIVGYDVAKRVLDGSGGYEGANAGGWHSTGSCGSFGAAAAAAKILGLDADQTANALGLAGSFTGGTWAFLADGSMSKRYHAGRAAETGILVAYLAQSGFTGPKFVLDAEWGGYFNLYAPDTQNLPTVTDDLGEDYRILHAGIKPYASCRGIHSAIDVILELRQSVGLRAEALESVTILCNERQKKQLGLVSPTSRLEAQFSLPYGVAIALLEGRASLDMYAEPWISSAEVQSLTSKVTLKLEPNLVGEPELVVITRSGETYQRRVDIARGAAENPLSNEEIIEKFKNLASRVYREADVENILYLVTSMNDGNLSPLLDAIGQAPNSLKGVC